MEKNDRSALNQLKYSVRVTANCKNNAANRLEKFKNISFAIIVMTSLGLIFIPIWFLAFPTKNHSYKTIIDISQIFLAIVILVFSIQISNSSYDVKIKNLRVCGSNLRSLTKKLRILEEELLDDKDRHDKDKHQELRKLLDEYEAILKDSEPHQDIDFLVTECEKDSFGKRIKKGYHFKKYLSLHFIYIYLTLVVAFFELFLILDILGLVITLRNISN
ncbi:SLATT domain-containing protein [Avibacterium gallinarum]|uniref:SLATT domain-containing protein n=3 Tax=Avibacterium gallinarum TaxID=755 RepID=UPI0039FDE093